MGYCQRRGRRQFPHLLIVTGRPVPWNGRTVRGKLKQVRKAAAESLIPNLVGWPGQALPGRVIMIEIWYSAGVAGQDPFVWQDLNAP
jgi:hypothetical protein